MALTFDGLTGAQVQAALRRAFNQTMTNISSVTYESAGNIYDLAMPEALEGTNFGNSTVWSFIVPATNNGVAPRIRLVGEQTTRTLVKGTGAAIEVGYLNAGETLLVRLSPGNAQILNRGTHETNDLLSFSGKLFASRVEAVNYTQEKLPAAIGRILVLENDILTLRAAGQNAPGSDPLFSSSPFWGIGATFPSRAIVNELIRQQTKVQLAVSGTADAMIGTYPSHLISAGITSPTATQEFEITAIGPNTVVNPTITINGTSYQMRNAEGGNWAIGSSVTGRIYTLRRVVNTVRVVSGAVSQNDITTETTNRRNALSLQGFHTLTNVSGTANAVVAELPANVVPVTGTKILLNPILANTTNGTTTTPTLLLTGWGGARDIRSESGGFLPAGDLAPGRYTSLIFTGSVWQVLQRNISAAEYRALQAASTNAMNRANHTGTQEISTVRDLSRQLNVISRAAGAVSPNDPKWLDAIEAIMSGYALVNLDKDSLFTGTESNVTAIQTNGTLNALFSVQNPELAAIQKHATGFQFANGAWLRALISGAAVQNRMFMLVDFTPLEGSANGAPVVATDLGDMAIDTSRMMFKVPGANVAYDIAPTFNGQRQVIAAEINATTRVARIWNTDGYILSANAPTSVVRALSDLRLGRQTMGILHRLMIFSIPESAEGFPIEPDYAWHRFAKKPLRDEKAIDIGWGWGQSIYQSWPVPVGERWALNQGLRRDLLMVNGLRTVGGAAVNPTGVGNQVIDQNVSATGLAPLHVNNGDTILFGMYRRLIKRREELKMPSPRAVCGVNGFGGQGAEEFDDDPTTGTTSTTLWNNNKYWLEQAIAQCLAQGVTPRLPYLMVIHGDAHKALPRGEYAQLFNRTQRQHMDLAYNLLGYAPKLIMSQNGGDTNTTNDGATGWEFLLDQIDLIKEHSGLLIGPQYPYLIGPESPLNVHPDHVIRRFYGELAAEAAVYDERGLEWNFFPPTEAEVTIQGNTVILPYKMPYGSSMFVIPEPNKYESYGGTAATCPNLGFDAPGRTINNIEFSGRYIKITLNAAPTILKYAMQVQDVIATADAENKGYTAHRGLISTDWKLNSAVVPGKVHRRWLPSYKWNFT